MRRRDLIIGGACLLGAAAGVAAKPRRQVSLLKGGALEDMVPKTFGGWVSQDVGDPLAINGPDSLTAKLYSQLVTRVYVNQASSSQVMMLLAYGSRQTDDLQLHRPEVCYPAFGYTLLRNEQTKLPVAPAVQLPSRRLIAQSPERQEAIVYWTRMGELLPSSGEEQRLDRVRIAMRGEVPDGVLCRFSAIVEDPGHAWRDIEGFVPGLLTAMAPKNRAVLIGTDRAKVMAASAI
jgi:EpsI family protein